MATRTFAAIDVGSYELGMKIFEFNSKGGMREIDYIRRRIELGTDTYHTGRISSDHMDELCNTLADFAEIMKGYKVDDYKAYGTSAIRETKNTVIVTEQIKLRSGLDVEVLSNSEQRFLNYKAVASKGDNFKKLINRGCAILDIGGGSIQISLFEDNALVTTQNIRLGVLRMMDMLSRLQPRTRDYANVCKELIDNQLQYFKRLYMKGREISSLIVLDDYVSAALSNVSKDIDIISAETFKEEIAKFDVMSTEEIASVFAVPEESVKLLTPSAAIMSRVVKITKADSLWFPNVCLCDGIAYEYAQKEKLYKDSHDFENDIIECAYAMSKRYQGNMERNQLFERISIQIFDAMKKIHKMDKRDKLLLRMAAILNDCGRYVSLEAGAECGYNIIMATEIIGLSHAEREIVANVVKFNKVKFEYYSEIAKTTLLDKETYLRIAKLSALFRLADGICRSYRTKVNEISTTLKDNELILSLDVDYDDDISLEQGFFYRKSDFFEEVFSVKPVLKLKRR